MTPYYQDESVTLHLGDCLDVLRTMEADSVDAIVTDPPAGIAFMDREWDDFRRARNPADAGRDNVFGRTSARGPEYGRRDRGQFVDMLTARLAEAYRVLKPGGHALVWSIPRTSHWTAWAIEDAGFDIRDCVLHLFGSGFPKSRDVSKAIDKAGGQSVSWFGPWLRQERERRGISSHELCERGGFYKNVNHGGLVVNWELGLGIPTAAQFNKVCEILDLDYPRIEVLEREVIAQGYRIRHESTVQIAGCSDGEYDITTPATEAGKRWEGWGTALKPGQEMWWLARKPIKGTVAGNVLEFGTGALNIAACLTAHASAVDLATSQGKNPGRDDKVTSGTYGGGRPQQSVNGAGRWPANIVLTHSAACEPLGIREVRSDGHHPATRGAGGLGTSGHAGQDGLAERKSGTESVTAWACAPDCPVGELDRQGGVTSVTGQRSARSRDALVAGTTWGTGNHRSREYPGDTGGASRFYPTFRYQAKAPASERPRLEDGTAHETVKSLGLMTWMVRLITPPGGTVLDMFAGSGPVGEVCVIEGFRCVLIEQDPKSAELIKTRLAKPIQPAMFGGAA